MRGAYTVTLAAYMLVMICYGASFGADFLADRHEAKKVSCAGCHGKEAPVKGDSVENSRCLRCHGSYEKLAAQTVPAQKTEGNPHASHLGEIECTICHYGHSASVVYCQRCHRTFEMKTPSGQ